MEIVRDLLDKGVIDRNDEDMGRVDGIIIDVGEGRPPRVVAFEIGPSVLGDRVHRRIGRMIASLERAFGVSAERPTRVDIREIRDIDQRVAITLAKTERGAFNVERALRKLLGSR